MSQPRRRRRRRRRSGGGGGGAPSDPARKQQASSGQPQQQQPGTQKKTRRRRGRGRGQSRQPQPAKSSEDLVRAEPRERPATLTAAPDGQTLEGIIGELQSVWGVPQYPQEYRITIKVAEERDQRPTESDDNGRTATEAPPRPGDGPRREKAPAAPLMRNRGPSEGTPSGEGGKRRRGRRRRRRGGGGGGQSGGGGGTPPS